MVTTFRMVQVTSHPSEAPGRPLLRTAGAATWTSLGLVVAALAAAVPSLVAPSLLDGPAVGQGCLRGTALVVLVGGVPSVLLGMAGALRGSSRALVVWGGGVAYLLYQGVLFCFATPMNALFLAYVAFLGFGVYAALTLSSSVDRTAIAGRIGSRTSYRLVPGVLASVAVLNAAGWLARIVPASLSDRPVDVLDGSGMITNPVWVQDLAFWIPLALVASVWMWQRRPDGVLLTSALVAFYALEGISVAVDQVWGAHADPAHPELASASVAVPMTLSSVVLLGFLALVWRGIDVPSTGPAGRG